MELGIFSPFKHQEKHIVFLIKFGIYILFKHKHEHFLFQREAQIFSISVRN